MSVGVHVSAPRLLITRRVMLTPYDLLNKFYNLYMAAAVGSISRHGISIEVYRKNQPN